MATAVTVLGAAGLAAYVYMKDRNLGPADFDLPESPHIRVEHAPNTWAESLHVFKEVVRFTVQVRCT